MFNIAMRHSIYGSILPGWEFHAYLCPYFDGENSTPVSIFWVQIKFGKRGWIDNYSWIIEKKFKFFYPTYC